MTWSYQQVLWNGLWRMDMKINLLSADPKPYQGEINCPMDSQGNSARCVVSQGTVIAETDPGRNSGVRLGENNNAPSLNFWGPQLADDVGQNPYKKQDFTNALSHLIALVRYQYQTQKAAAIKQEQQQNQGDPFANPQ